MGMLMRIDSTPTGMPVSRRMIWAMPVTPPETMLFGNVKNWNAAATSAEPTTSFI